MKIILLVILCSCASYSAADSTIYLSLKDSIRQISKATGALQEELKIIRRDQINHEIEKNLLKETYSTNFTTFNAVVSIMLVIFGFFGFFGLRDINTQKKEYNTEFENKKRLFEELNSKNKQLLANFETKISNIDEELTDLKTNIEQENVNSRNRLNLIYFKNNVTTSIEAKDYNIAYNILKENPSLAEENIDLLIQKGFLEIKLLHFKDAIQTQKLIIEKNNSTVAKTNLIELLLLDNQYNEAVNYLEQYNSNISELFGPVIIDYLEVFSVFIKKDYTCLRNRIKNSKLILVNSYNNNWDFDILFRNINKLNQSVEKNKLFKNYIYAILKPEETNELLEGV